MIMVNEEDMLASIDRALSRSVAAPAWRPVRRDSPLPTVSIVIPVLNDAAGLTRCLASIAANGYPADRLEVIVADNGSTDASGQAAVDAGATLMRLDGLSVAAVRNRVAAVASGDVLAFVDADHELSSDWIRSAVEALAESGVAAVGAPYHAPANATWVQRLYDSFRSRTSVPSETRWLGSGNLAIWKRAFIDVGGFDTSLVTCEDVDFCQRLRQSGKRLIADERLRSVHHGDPRTLQQLFNSELWRGRDNLRVSFSGPLALRDVPSVAIPVLVLASLIALPAAGVAAWLGMALPLMLAIGITTAAPAARAVAMIQRRGGGTPLHLAQAFMVASTYDVARALALVVRKSHRRAR